MKKLLIVSVLLLGSFSLPLSASAYEARCSFADGGSWWGSSPTTTGIAQMGLYCEGQGGHASFHFSDILELVSF